MEKMDLKLLKGDCRAGGHASGRLQHPQERRRGRADQHRHIVIDTKTDKPGIDIRIAPGTKHESRPYPGDHYRDRPHRAGLQRFLHR